ncbi:MAG: hypothetical protein MJ106_06550, partial [Lentisphaeria bacterium]|nr:hypothetical protein [Lentisphaeria bacterium]
LACPVGANDDGYPEYREHWEIVLFNKGLNVWHHMYSDGKPSWEKIASDANYRAPDRFKAGQKYELTVKIFHDEVGYPWGTVTCDDSVIRFPLNDFPEEVLAGITACEGENRFYDFKISK